MIQEVENQNLIQLRKYLARISDQLRAGQLYWDFEIRLFEIGDSEFSLAEIIRFAYPEAKPEKAQITATTFYDFQETLDYWFTTDLSGKPPGKWLIRGAKDFAYLLNECIYYADATIYEYRIQNGLDPLGVGMTRGFAFVFINRKQGRALFIIGGDTD